MGAETSSVSLGEINAGSAATLLAASNGMSGRSRTVADGARPFQAAHPAGETAR